MAAHLLVERSVQIDRPPETVFDFLADGRNDPRWCPKVRSAEQTLGDGPQLGARYQVVHQPTRIKPAAELTSEIVAFEPPHSIALRQEDGDGVFNVEYLIERANGGTRFTQRSEVEWKLPAPLRLIASRMVPRHLDGQMKKLKSMLESGDSVAG